MLFAAPCRLCEQVLTHGGLVPVCESCLGRVRPLEMLSYCDRCQRPLPYSAPAAESPALCGTCRLEEIEFDRLRSFGPYDAELRAMIVLLKYNRVRPLARPLAGWVALVLKQNPALAEADAIVPVPLHPSRQRQRGYNQAELIARELGRWLALSEVEGTKLPVRSEWLARVKDTPSQTGLTPAQRVENVRGAFAAHTKLDFARILLLDDVCTTGATLDACARTLKRAGAASVGCVTVARVVKELVAGHE